MGLQWEKTGPGESIGVGLRVHSLSPGERALVCFLSDQDGIWSHSVHWLPEQRKGFPCLGADKCPVCPMPATLKWYAPILLYHGRGLPRVGTEWAPKKEVSEVYDSLIWRKSVLEITQSWADIIHKAQRGACFHLVRGNGGRNSRTAFEWYGRMTEPSGALLDAARSFDVRPVLARVWGIRSEAA